MDDTLIKRLMPHSAEAEQSVIGSMLMSHDAIVAAAEVLTKEDFYQSQYGVIFEAMLELYNENKPVELITLQNRLKEKDVPPEVASLDYVRDIYALVPTSVNIRHYAQIVKEKSTLRRLITTNEEIANLCYAGKENIDSILQQTEDRIFRLLQNKTQSAFEPVSEIAMQVFADIEEALRNGGAVSGLPTGYADLDYRTSGLQKSDLILLAARPSMGKTAFVLNLLDHIAVAKGYPCLMFSLEMSRKQLVSRLLSMEARVDSQKMRTGVDLSDRDWDNLAEGVARIGGSNIIIDDTPGITVSEMRTKCRKVKLQLGDVPLRLIVIDYLQLMSGSGRGGENRQQEISEISRSLKALAREMDAPVVALSQLSRACESRPDHRPELSDLRESGAIEQDADLVMFLYRDEYYHPDTEAVGEAELIIKKQRNGPIGTVRLKWLPEIQRFANLERGR
ncbi:MAG: replicative DNA helicase [Lachnospiraceae bacterium]|jgi:replicative DNA helicase|nr:replicative DNA helicase [Lachnospiraceae bacterium]